MNEVSLIGRLCKDIELKYTQSNKKYIRFTVAVARRIKSKIEGSPDADFINCVAWEKLAEVIDKYFKKGDRIGIIGSLQTGSYDGKNGKVYTTDVLVEKIDFIETKKDAVKEDEPQAKDSEIENVFGCKPGTTSLEIDEEDLPFY